MNVDMVKNGYAWYYQQYARNRADLKAAETFARTNKLGLWKGTPVAPWLFRKKK
ncbi:MAG: thermonuclease family protein [Fusobacteriaceae bacterium]